jgi:hypothetical protein
LPVVEALPAALSVEDAALLVDHGRHEGVNGASASGALAEHLLGKRSQRFPD